MAFRTSRCILALWLLCLAACGSSNGAGFDPDGPQERTSAAVVAAQVELYSALYKDPPDYDAAAARMSLECRRKSADPKVIVAEPFAEVELAQSIDLGLESLLAAFSQISYTIDGEAATGDDGSSWIYEDGVWHLQDC